MVTFYNYPVWQHLSQPSGVISLLCDCEPMLLEGSRKSNARAVIWKMLRSLNSPFETQLPT